MNSDNYWQKIRGICIIAVVWIHASGYSDTLDYKTLDGIYYFVIRNLLSFPVAFLFFLSGYFIKQYDNWGGYIKKRIVRIGVPYIVFSFGYITFQLLLLIRGHHDLIDYLLTIPRIILLGEAATPFYFSIVLLVFSCITPLLFYILNSKYHYFPYLISAILVLSLYMGQLRNCELVRYAPLTPIWLCFYYSGMMTKNGKIKVLSIVRLRFFLCLSMLMLFSESLLLLTMTSTGPFAYSQMRISAFIYSAILIQIALRKHEDTNVSVISKIGDMSYGIYLIHCFWMQFAWILYDKVLCYTSIPLVIIQAGELFICLLLSVGSILLLQRLFKDKARILFGV